MPATFTVARNTRKDHTMKDTPITDKAGADRFIREHGKRKVVDLLRAASAERHPDPVTPGEIDAVEFTQVVNWFTGRHDYDEHEVDAFLDRVGATLAAQMRENQALGAIVERRADA